MLKIYNEEAFERLIRNENFGKPLDLGLRKGLQSAFLWAATSEGYEYWRLRCTGVSKWSKKARDSLLRQTGGLPQLDLVIEDIWI